MAVGPTVLVELKDKKGFWHLVAMKALDAVIFWDSEPLIGIKWFGLRVRWGEVNAREWDMSV